jgi:hypothetical protein
LWQQKDWLPTHKLQSRETDFGFIGSSGEQRVRELARNAPGIPEELRDKIEKRRGSQIGLDPHYEYFRFNARQNHKPGPALSDREIAARRVALFDAGAPPENIFAV